MSKTKPVKARTRAGSDSTWREVDLEWREMTPQEVAHYKQRLTQHLNKKVDKRRKAG
jgi:hypothetical protein